MRKMSTDKTKPPRVGGGFVVLVDCCGAQRRTARRRGARLGGETQAGIYGPKENEERACPFFSFRVCERSLHEIKGFGLPLHGINPFAHGIGGCGFRIHPQPPIPCSLTSMNPHPACKTPGQTCAFDSRVWMRRPYLPISCKMPSNTRAGRRYSSTGLCFVHTPGIRSTHRPPRKRACDEKEKRGLTDFQITTASCRLSSQMRRRVCLFSHLHEMES